MAEPGNTRGRRGEGICSRCLGFNLLRGVHSVPECQLFLRRFRLQRGDGIERVGDSGAAFIVARLRAHVPAEARAFRSAPAPKARIAKSRTRGATPISYPRAPPARPWPCRADAAGPAERAD